MPETLAPPSEADSDMLPGIGTREADLFDVRFGPNGEQLDFTDPNDRTFPLAPDETVVQGEMDENGQRKTYIVSSEGVTDFEEWGPKIVADNLEGLRETGVGKYFAGLYEAALAEDPRLEQVRIFTSNSKENPKLGATAGFANHRGDTQSGNYELTVNTQDGWMHFQKLFKSRARSATDSAAKLGITPENMAAEFNYQALAGFIFLHELGHIVDYMDNAPDHATKEARRERDMNSLPLPGWNPAKLTNYMGSEAGQQYWEQHKSGYEKKGIKTPQDLIARQEQAYHALVTEDNPDQFAARVYKKVLDAEQADVRSQPWLHERASAQASRN